LIFEVSDNGMGMDYNIKQKLFTTFFTTKGGGGTGLGLLTTRKIVQEHGGTIDFESEEDKGSIFRLCFPRKRLPKPAEQEINIKTGDK
jgi:signal transduction histidine kinase